MIKIIKTIGRIDAQIPIKVRLQGAVSLNLMPSTPLSIWPMVLLFLLLSIAGNGQGRLGGMVSVPNAEPIVAVDYFIATSGSPSGDCLSVETACTVDKFVTVNVQNKAQLKFNKGESFYFGDYAFSHHLGGVSSYGSGADPELTGSESIAGLVWTAEGSGVYSTPMSVAPKGIFLSNTSSKWAQTAWIQIASTPSSGVVKVLTASLSGYASSLIGSKLRVVDQQYWMSYEYTVTNYNGTNGDITLDRPIPEAAAGKYISLYGQRQFISANNDWAWESDVLYYKSASSPTGLDLKACTKDYAFNVTARDITITGISFNQYGKSAILGADSRTSGLSISEVTVTNVKQRGILLIGTTGSTVDDCVVTKCGADGIRVSGNNNTVTDNESSTIGMDLNFQLIDEIANVSRTAGTGIGVRGNGNTVTGNLVYNTAWCGIVVNGTSAFGNNHIYEFGKRFWDVAGAYTSGVTGGENYSPHIYSNIVHNGASSPENVVIMGVDSPPVAFYIDHITYGAIVEDNIAWSVPGEAYKINFTTSSTTFRRNRGARSLVPVRWVSTATLSTSTNNVLVATGSAGECVEVTGGTPWTTADNNRYINPYRTQIGQAASTEETLAQWQTRYSKDASSSAMVNYITWSNATNAAEEVKIEYNFTGSAVDFALPAGYKQEDGTSGGTISIPAYQGRFYLKETAFP
jgi:parallel beta-helix repeat protein